MEFRRAGMVDAWLVLVFVGLAAAFVNALLSHLRVSLEVNWRRSSTWRGEGSKGSTVGGK